MVRLTLISRIALIIFASLAIVWIVAIAAFYRSHHDEFRPPHPEPRQLAALVQLAESVTPQQRALLIGATSNPHLYIQVVDAGTTLAPLVGTPVSEHLHALYAAAVEGRALDIVVRPRLPLLRNLPNHGLRLAKTTELRVTLRTGATLIVIEHSPLAINRFGVPVGFTVGLVGTAIALVALFLTQRETKPLERLAEAVDRIDLSGAPVRVPETRRGAPEIRALVAAFNRLQGRIDSMLRARMALLGGISHDVRTFATRLRLRTEAIPDPAERQRATADIDDMILLLDDALLSSRAGAGELTQELIDIAPFVQAESEDRRAEGARVTCRFEEEAKRASILGDRLALRRILGNLIDNALKYGRSAHLEISLQGDQVVLTVDDEGPGIPPDQCALMLEPFSRLETSRNRGTGGAGLGLAVVRTLVEAQAGKIAITTAPTGGARVVLCFPLFHAAGGGARA